MESLAAIKQRLASEDPEARIDALLDAYEYGTAGIELVINALQDRDRKVRQSAQLLLSESDKEIAKQALWNYLPFPQMQCLHTITDFKCNYFDEQYHPYYFAIADYNNSLIISYDEIYERIGFAIFNLETGINVKNDYVQAYGFKLGKRGKVYVDYVQHIINVYSLEN